MGKYGFSLEKKVKRIAACAGAVVFFSMSANLLITWFGLGGFGAILESNAESLAFWSAIDAESLAFEHYVSTSMPEDRKRFLETSRHVWRLFHLIIKRLGRSGMPGSGLSEICMRLMKKNWKFLNIQKDRSRNMWNVCIASTGFRHI